MVVEAEVYTHTHTHTHTLSPSLSLSLSLSQEIPSLNGAFMSTYDSLMLIIISQSAVTGRVDKIV